MFVLGGVEKIAGDAELLETRSVLKFDSGTQAWSEVEPMLRALSNCSTCVLGSNIFVLGGFDGEKSVESTFCYNTLTNLWKTLAPMPGAKMGPSICVLSGLIYTIGGSTTMTPIRKCS
jgi:hypothetical protein